MSDQFELSTEEKVKMAQDEETFRKQEYKLALAYGEVFRSPAGQFVLADLRARCNIDNSVIRDNIEHPDPNAVLVQAGKQCVYQHINNYLRQDNERRKQQ